MTKTPPVPGRRVPSRKARSFNARFNAGLSKLLAKLKVDDVPHIKRIIVTVVGGTVLLLGAAMVFLPGPGLLVMLGGLALLGTEYAWARRWLRKSKLMANKALSKTQEIFTPKDKPETSSAAEPLRKDATVPMAGTSATKPLGDKMVSLAL